MKRVHFRYATEDTMRQLNMDVTKLVVTYHDTTVYVHTRAPKKDPYGSGELVAAISGVAELFVEVERVQVGLYPPGIPDAMLANIRDVREHEAAEASVEDEEILVEDLV